MSKAVSYRPFWRSLIHNITCDLTAHRKVKQHKSPDCPTMQYCLLLEKLEVGNNILPENGFRYNVRPPTRRFTRNARFCLIIPKGDHARWMHKLTLWEEKGCSQLHILFPQFSITVVLNWQPIYHRQDAEVDKIGNRMLITITLLRSLSGRINIYSFY